MSYTRDDLLEFYTSMLESLGFEVADNGKLSINLIDGDSQDGTVFTQPVEVNKTYQIYLPTKKLVSGGAEDSDDKLLFHPLSENILRGESTIQAVMRKVMRVGLTMDIINILKTLTRISANPELQEKFSTKAQVKVLSQIGPMSSKAIDHMDQLCGIKALEALGPILSVHAHKNHKDYESKRVTIFTSLVFEQIDDVKQTIAGVKIATKKDFKAITNLLKVVLSKFNFVSESNGVVPFMESLYCGFAEAQTHVRELTKLFKSEVNGAEHILGRSSYRDWIDLLTNEKAIAQMKLVQPDLRGNIGNTSKIDEMKAESVKRDIPDKNIPLNEDVNDEGASASQPILPPSKQSSLGGFHQPQREMTADEKFAAVIRAEQMGSRGASNFAITQQERAEQSYNRFLNRHRGNNNGGGFSGGSLL